MAENNEGLVFNIQKFSLHDGPGIRTSIFLKGCPLSCLWCANPESQNPYINFFIKNNGKSIRLDVDRNKLNFDDDGYVREDEKLKIFLEDKGLEDFDYQQVARPIKVSRLVDIALEDKVFYDNSGGGVTISGGEPLMQADFLYSLLKALKEAKIHTAIETSLFASFEKIEKIIDYVDLWIIDSKHFDPNIHKKMVGADNYLIIDNLKKVMSMANDYLIRIPIIPGFNYSKETAYGFGKYFNQIGIKRVQLLPFHQMGEQKYENYGLNYHYKDQKALDDESLSQMIEILRAANIDAFV